MSYIGSNPLTQYFKDGTDSFAVGATATAVFTLTRPVSSIHDIEVITGTTVLVPNGASYTVSGNQLTLGTAVSNLTVYVRYLSTSTYSIVPTSGSVSANALLASSGTPSRTSFYRGDGVWALPNIPQNTETAAYTLVAGDNGFHISITTGGVTIPKDIMSVGDAVTIYNNSTSNQTITQATDVTVRLAGTNTTGNRTLAQYGVATVLCVASNVFVISGQGVS